MKTKKGDEVYCGVRQDKIKSAKPILNTVNAVHFQHYIRERYLVRCRKEFTKAKAPWTDNEVLQKYRFTNVRREHDTQTKHLIKHVSLNASLSLEDKIINTFFFRSWNNLETFDFFGLPKAAVKLYSPKAKEVARAKLKFFRSSFPKAYESRKWWSGAYNQGGMKRIWRFPDGEGYEKEGKGLILEELEGYEPEIPLRIFHLGPELKKFKLAQGLLDCSNQKEVFEFIKGVRGFADFMAYQVFVDLTYIPEFPFSENEFTVAGPGCKLGLSYLFTDNDGLTSSEQIFWLRDNVEKWYGIDSEALFNDLQPYDRCFNVMMLENCLCEISKYIKAVDGTGRPRQLYKPAAKK